METEGRGLKVSRLGMLLSSPVPIIPSRHTGARQAKGVRNSTQVSVVFKLGLLITPSPFLLEIKINVRTNHPVCQMKSVRT